MEALRSRDLQQADLHAAPIANVGQLFAGTKGIEVDAELFNPYAAALYRQEAQGVLKQAIAQTFLKLTAQQKVPAWALETVDLKLIRAAV